MQLLDYHDAGRSVGGRTRHHAELAALSTYWHLAAFAIRGGILRFALFELQLVVVSVALDYTRHVLDWQQFVAKTFSVYSSQVHGFHPAC